jgi:hypothetical protein
MNIVVNSAEPRLLNVKMTDDEMYDSPHFLDR